MFVLKKDYNPFKQILSFQLHLFLEKMFHSKTFTKSCCVKNCSNNNSKEGMKFHLFPKDPNLFEVWKKVVDRPDYVIKNNSFMCMMHFSKSQAGFPFSNLFPRVISQICIFPSGNFPDFRFPKRQLPKFYLLRSVPSMF